MFVLVGLQVVELFFELRFGELRVPLVQLEARDEGSLSRRFVVPPDALLQLSEGLALVSDGIRVH